MKPLSWTGALTSIRSINHVRRGEGWRWGVWGGGGGGVGAQWELGVVNLITWDCWRPPSPPLPASPCPQSLPLSADLDHQRRHLHSIRAAECVCVCLPLVFVPGDLPSPRPYLKRIIGFFLIKIWIYFCLCHLVRDSFPSSASVWTRMWFKCLNVIFFMVFVTLERVLLFQCGSSAQHRICSTKCKRALSKASRARLMKGWFINRNDPLGELQVSSL